MRIARLLAGLLLLTGGLSARAQTDSTQPTGPTWPTIIDGRDLKSWVADLRHADPSMREEAIRAVVAFGPPACSRDIVKTIIERTLDRDAVLRVRATMALTIMDIRKDDIPLVVNAFANLLENDTQTIVRYQAAVGLVRYEDNAKPALNALIKGSADLGSYVIRQQSVIALYHAGRNTGAAPDRAAVTAMYNRLSDTTICVKLEALRGLAFLGKTGDPTVQANLEAKLRELTRVKDRVVVIWAWIALMGVTDVSPEIVKAIGAHLKDPQVRIKIAAAEALGQMGNRARFALPDLIEMLKDKEPHVIVTAIWTIGQIEDPGQTALAALTDLTKTEVSKDKSTNEFVQKYAQAAVDALTKKNNKAP
jgi:HEAT repeat protein